MPTSLRYRLALFGLLGAFLIPVGISSLRGLTHVLTCTEETKSSFTIEIPQSGQPVVSSSVRLVPGETGLCGGLAVDIAAGTASPTSIRIIVAITNPTDDPWRGTVRLELSGVAVLPVGIGAIPPGGTEADTVEVRLSPGIHAMDGVLLIGP